MQHKNSQITCGASGNNQLCKLDNDVICRFQRLIEQPLVLTTLVELSFRHSWTQSTHPGLATMVKVTYFVVPAAMLPVVPEAQRRRADGQSAGGKPGQQAQPAFLADAHVKVRIRLVVFILVVLLFVGRLCI